MRYRCQQRNSCAGKKGAKRVNYCFITFENWRSAQRACNQSERNIHGKVIAYCISGHIVWPAAKLGGVLSDADSMLSTYLSFAAGPQGPQADWCRHPQPN